MSHIIWLIVYGYSGAYGYWVYIYIVALFELSLNHASSTSIPYSPNNWLSPRTVTNYSWSSYHFDVWHVLELILFRIGANDIIFEPNTTSWVTFKFYAYLSRISFYIRKAGVNCLLASLANFDSILSHFFGNFADLLKCISAYDPGPRGLKWQKVGSSLSESSSFGFKRFPVEVFIPRLTSILKFVSILTSELLRN